MTDTTGFHPSQVAKDGSLIPQWPSASHFKEWHFVPFMFNNKPADLYFWMNSEGRGDYVSMNDLLIGIQVSPEDGAYMSPFIETGNALNSVYLKDHRNDVLAAYLIACVTLGITPSFSPRR